MDSTMVIKVKFGETLRRFNAKVVDEELALDMNGLREKIFSLFNFAPESDLTLTYVDEDGDVVTLVDDEDLRDVMRQLLNPLRVTVMLNAEKNGRSYARSSGSSTPMRSPRVQLPLQKLNTSVSEIFKSVPEPFRDAFSKLSTDLASKATSSAGFAELADCFSNMGLTHLNQFSEFQAGKESSTLSGASGRTMSASDIIDQRGTKVDGSPPEMLPALKSEVPTLQDNQVLPNAEPTPKSDKVDLGKVTGSVEASVMPAPGSVYLKPSSATEISAAEKLKDSINSSDSHDGFERKPNGFRASNPDYLKECLQDSQTTGTGDSIWTRPYNDSGSSSGWFRGLVNECPFTGLPLANESYAPYAPHAPRVAPFKRSYKHSDGIGSAFHRGVRCDGCGVHPITGPRFKSKVKENYDLCSICFAGMGNEADYVRMDHPLLLQNPFLRKGMYDPSPVRPPTLPQVLRGSTMKSSSRMKLDSRFIQDVNILDGTNMAPSTAFTKIWRMSNNGTIVWPQGSQLLWIGGDRLSDTLSVELEIPADGLHVDKVLDIAVDFTAPELPGRYISYWRMTSPSGQKFGQRVWVLIQVIENSVDASRKDLSESIHILNLNLPPVISGIMGPEIVNVKVEPMVEDSLPEPFHFSTTMELVEPIVDANPNKIQDLNFSINDTLLVGGGVSSTLAPSASLSVSYPIIDFSGEALVSLAAQSPSTDVQAPAGQEEGGNEDREQILLRELEEMGFKQVDLNKEILRMNEYNLEQSVDELCGVAEWDPILEELKEMGFCDQETNKRLLKKNNGSVKRVVMDLITGEKV